FNLGGSDGTIQGTNVANPVFTLGNGNTLNGITITGGGDGIFGNNITGATLTNVTVTGAGGNGADFTGSSTGITGSNFTATGNGLDGLHIDGDGTYNFTGTTLLKGNLDDGLDITGKGTYTFATVNAQDNTDRGITVQGTSTGGTFTTTGGTVSGNGGTAVFIDPITAHVVLDSISQSGGTSGVVLENVAGSFTVNGATTISNTTGPAIAISDSPATIRFGDISITNPGADGISFAGVNAAVVAGNIVISGLGVGTGLDFSGSKTNFTAQSLSITGTGAAGSIGIDLTSPSVGGAVIIITDGGVITNVDTGVRLGIAGTPGATANAEFTFGGNSSSISGITASLDARGLNEGSGHYAFGTTAFSGPQLYDLRNYIFVAAGASGGGTSITDLASIEYADSITASDAIIVLVNRGTIDDATGFSLSDGQELASFGNDRAFSLGGVPLNVTGTNIHHDESISDSAGAATLTSSGGGNVVTLGNGNTLLDFNVSGGSGSAIYGLGINGLTVQGVTASNVGSGLYLNGVTGTVSVDDLTVQTASQTGIVLVDSSATVDFTGNTKITSAANVGLFANNFDGIATFDDLDISGGGRGVAIWSGSSGTLTFAAASSITNTDDVAFNINGAVPNVTYNGTIDQANAANAVRIIGQTGGTATFGGKITASTGSANAIDLSANTGGTVKFTGGLDLTTTTGTGFDATGGGTITVAAAGTEQITTGTGRAINLDGITIGTGGMAFDSITTGVATATALNFNAVSGGQFLGGNVTVGGTAAGINGLAINASSSTFTITNLVTTNVAGTDVSLTNNTGSITILGGTIANSGAGDGVVVSGGSATVGVAANVSSSATAPGAAVKVDGTTGGSVTFSGTVTSTGTGDLFDVGSTLTPAGGAISFTGPTLSATGGGGALVSSLGGTATLNVTAPLSITNATGTGLSVTNVASTASASFGEVTVTTPGGTGIFIADNGTVTFGTTQVTLGAASTAGIEFLDINEHISFGTTTIDEVGANQTGIDFSGSSSGSSTRADFGLTTITGTGSLTSRGIDLSSTTGNKTIAFLRGSSISNVGVGVELSSSGATATSANANFTFGDGTSADGLQSSISAAAGGYTVNTIGLDPTLGNYDFDDVNFTGAAHLASAVGGTIMISQGGGIVHANTDGLSADVTTYTVAEADAMTGTLNFAFVGTVDLSGTPFTLDSGQSIIGFGNGASILTSGTVQPVNVQGNLGATGGNVTGDEGVVKSTGSDTLHLLGNNQVRDTAFDFSGGSGSVFLVDGSAAGFVNTGGIFIEGVTVSNVAVGQTAFKVAGLDTNLSIADNNVNVAGTLLDVDGGAGNITVTRGTLPNSGPAGTLTGGGINLQNLTGTVTIGDGTLTNTGANTAFNVGSTTAGSGGSAIISYAGTINSNGTGAAVSIQSMTGGSVTLSGNLTDTNAAAGGNIVIAGNDSAAITFSGTSKVISSGATDAVSLGLVGNFPAGTPAPNTNSAINFTNGGLDITTTTGTGFIAFGDFTTGAVTVTGTGNEINSGADGLILFGANVGAGGVAFDSVSAVSTSTGAGVLLGGINLGGDVNIGGLRDTGYIGASLIGLSGAGVVNFTGKTDLDVSYRGFDIGGPLVGTINIANVAGSTLNIDDAEIGIALTTSSGTVNVGGNGGSASIGATTSTTGSAITLAGGNDLVHATLNYTGSINVSAGSVLQVGGGDWSELNMSGSVVSTSAVALPGTAVFTFSGNAEGVYNISSTINHTGSAVGVLFDGSSEGTATFSGTSKIFDTSSGANGAIVKLPSIGPTQGTGTLAFTNGGLVITTSSGAGFTASTFAAGTVSVSGAGNTITTGTGTALDLDSATVGAGGITFDSISSNGAATGVSLNNVGGGAIDLGAVNLQNITSRGVDISGTLGSALSFDSLNIGIAASATNAVGLDLNGAALGTSTITADDFDVDGGNSTGSIGIDMAGTTGTGTIQLGDLLNNNPGPAGQTSTITKVAQGVQFSSATNARLVFGDGGSPAESKIETFGNGQVIHATDTLPTNGDYNFNDVNFSGDTSNLSSYKVYYVTADATALGDGSLLNPGTYANAQASTANVIVLINKNVDGGQATIDLGGTSFQLDDGQVLLAFKSDDAAVDVSQLGVDTSAGASAAFHFTTVQNSPIIAAPAGIDTLRPILQSNTAGSVVDLATSGSGVVTGGLQNLIIRNTGTGTGVAVNATSASSFFLRNNDIAAGGRALDFSTSAAPANTLLLSIDGNTLKSTGSALAASFAGQNISATDNSVEIQSFADNTVLGGTGGGIAFNNVRFDSNGAGGTVSAGTIGVGSPGPGRVQGDGLSFTNTSGTLDLGAFSVFNNGGTGVLANTKTTNFTLNSSSGGVFTGNGAAFDLDPLTVNMVVTSISSGGSSGGIIFDGIAGTFTVTGNTSVAAATTAGIMAINAGNTGVFTFNTVTLNSAVTAGGGIQVASGTLNITGLANIDTTTGVGVSQTGGTVSFTGGVTIDTASGTGIVGTGGTMGITATAAAETVRATTGQAINLSGVAASIALDSTNSVGGANNVRLTNVSGTVDLGSGALSGATGTAFLVSGGSANIDYNGTITHTANATAIDVQNHTGTAGGGSTISFDGAITSNSFSDGINLVANGGTNGTTISFTNKLAIDTSTSDTTGFSATGGGTVTATGPGSTINSGTGTALDVENTNIGSGNLVFQSITSNGGSANGIILVNTGTALGNGGLHVTGNGANVGATGGGVIANKTGADGSATQGTGIYLSNTKDVQLNGLQLNDFDNFGIRGFEVNGFALTNSVVNATSGTNGTSAAADEGSISFRAADAAHNGLTGTVAITNSVIANGLEDNFNVFNNSGTLNITVSGSTFRDTSVGPPGNVGLLLQADGTANITGLVTNSSFLRNFARGIQLINNGSGNIDFDVGQAGVAGSGGTFTDNFVGVDMDQNGAGTYNFNVLNATFTTANYATLFGAGGAGSQINVNRGGAASPVVRGLFTGNILNNNINNADSGTGPGISVSVNGTATGSNTVTVKLDGNTVTHVANYGILVANGDGNGIVNATITNNTVSTTTAAALEAIRVNGGITSSQAGASGTPDNGTLTFDIHGNTLSVDPSAGVTDIRVRQRFNVIDKIEGYAGSATDDTAVQAYLASLNSHSGGGAATVAADHNNTGFGTIVGVTEPPLP
ncbi:hypothetical protein EN991_10630, partial [Mesorhizobium sp. M7A.F.Ca.US.005.03.2.1]